MFLLLLQVQKREIRKSIKKLKNFLGDFFFFYFKYCFKVFFSVIFTLKKRGNGSPELPHDCIVTLWSRHRRFLSTVGIEHEKGGESGPFSFGFCRLRGFRLQTHLKRS
ncbi:hypothetical protein V6Z11_A11G264600 [Gossypium hirsutum]